jgi:hypothetical protein
MKGINQPPVHKPQTAPRSALPFSENPEFSAMHEHLSRDADFSDYSNEKLEKFYTFLRELALQCGLAQEYDDAQSARDLSDLVLDELNHRKPAPDTGRGLVELAEQEKTDFEERWMRQLSEYDDQTRQKREQLKGRQADDEEKFEAMWMDDMPRKYRKPSCHLLQLRKIERSLALAGNYQKAKKAHLDVEQLAQIEMTNAQSQLMRDYEVARKKFVERQRQEIELFEVTREHDRSLLIAQYEAEKIAIQRREVVVQRRLEQPPAKKPKMALLNPPVVYQARDRLAGDDVLLPPLRPPNDPALVAEQSRRKREDGKRKFEYQRKNAERTLLRYSVDPASIPDAVPAVEEDEAVRVIEANGIRVTDKRIRRKELPVGVEDPGTVEEREWNDETDQPDEIEQRRRREIEQSKLGPPLDPMCHSFLDAQTS